MSDDVHRKILDEIDEISARHGQTLFEREKKILDLYDELEEIGLEMALLNAQNNLSDTPIAESDLQDSLQTAEREVTEARASYVLRNKVIQDVVITDPVLKAVHGGSHATPIERNLLPLINARDCLSMLESQLAINLRETHAKVSNVKRANMIATQKNRKLTQELMDLVEQTKPPTMSEVQDHEARARLANLEREIKPLTQQWRVMKGVLAGSIVGSGVDWARDPTLRDLVMDDEDEMA